MSPTYRLIIGFHIAFLEMREPIAIPQTSCFYLVLLNGRNHGHVNTAKIF